MWRRNTLLLSGILGWTVPALAQPTLTEPGWQVQVFQSGTLDSPTSMVFLGLNDCFILQKNDGKVLRATGVNDLSPDMVLDLPVNSVSVRGLLDIALHPNFGRSGAPNNDKVYLYYSRNSTANDSSVDGVWLENRLSQFTWDGSALVNETVLQTFGTSTDGQTQATNHNGGPITFGPDGKLYGITGDLNRMRAEQNNENDANSSALVGGIYRLNDDGSVPADNPFSTHANADFHRWYAYGIRNSFGLEFDPATDFLWDTENGPDAYDEVNLVAPGFNSGWVDLMGPDARDPQGTGGLVHLAPGSASTYSDPEFSWLMQIAPTAIHFLHGSALGTTYDDDALIADTNLGHLYMYTLNEARDGFVLSGGLADMVADNAAERDQARVGFEFGAATDLVRGPDGYIYVVSLSNGSIYRIFRATGDFNNDGAVDAADYAVWRDMSGQSGAFLAADHSGPTSGLPDSVVDEFDYDFWRARFGQTAGSGLAAAGPASATVPEPDSVLLAIVSVLGLVVQRRRTACIW